MDTTTEYWSTRYLTSPEVSRWSAYLYKSRLRVSTTLQDSVSRIAGGLLERSPKSRDVQKESRRCQDLAKAFGREVFSRLYDGDLTLLETPAAGTELLTKCHQVLQDLPEREGLRTQVHGDPDMAAVATAQVLTNLSKVFPSLREEEKKKAQEDGREETRETRRSRRRNRGPKADPDGVLRRGLRVAVSQSQDVVGIVRSGLEGINPGSGAPPAIHDQDGTDRMVLADKISQSRDLQKVMKLAGRLRRVSQRKHGTTGEQTPWW